MTKDSPWHSLTCVCFLNNPWCTGACHDIPEAWEQVEAYLEKDEEWDLDDVETFEPVRKKNTKKNDW